MCSLHVFCKLGTLSFRTACKTAPECTASIERWWKGYRHLSFLPVEYKQSSPNQLTYVQLCSKHMKSGTSLCTHGQPAKTSIKSRSAAVSFSLHVPYSFEWHAPYQSTHKQFTQAIFTLYIVVEWHSYTHFPLTYLLTFERQPQPPVSHI